MQTVFFIVLLLQYKSIATAFIFFKGATLSFFLSFFSSRPLSFSKELLSSVTQREGEDHAIPLERDRRKERGQKKGKEKKKEKGQKKEEEKEEQNRTEQNRAPVPFQMR